MKIFRFIDHEMNARIIDKDERLENLYNKIEEIDERISNIIREIKKIQKT